MSIFLVPIYFAVGILVIAIIIGIIWAIVNAFSGKEKKGTVTAIVQYKGKDANGNDILDIKMPKKDPPQTSPSPGSGAPPKKSSYLGKDEYGNDKFDLRI